MNNMDDILNYIPKDEVERLFKKIIEGQEIYAKILWDLREFIKTC